ncbi:hypothetical protein BDV37DRAFT_270390 [Aspergillus pseudonomiae]|uniref:Uncharacterized protein n=1 Tax=Aspergillus pseudonomiae TaxID=1506151 RepID=A0A5N7DHL0_9EURO|nr:uncharacterized protein BDV37DRAFT_270390 [Aspergillus pseudonomiae]KAE8405931.1 hypothetical protein BDV37DRAFT_270390 [Aspergillus pseudonomiae]
MAAAKAILDEVHPPLSQPETNHNVYIFGRVSNHNIVVAYLSAIVLYMISTFRSIRFGLMMGIGDGVPSQSVDICLGNIIISKLTTILNSII